MRFRSSTSAMTGNSSLGSASPLSPPSPLPRSRQSLPVRSEPQSSPLTLGDAAQLAARPTSARGARLRANEADARVRQRKADSSSYGLQLRPGKLGRTFTTSRRWVFDPPHSPRQKPVFDRKARSRDPSTLSMSADECSRTSWTSARWDACARREPPRAPRAPTPTRPLNRPRPSRPTPTSEPCAPTRISTRGKPTRCSRPSCSESRERSCRLEPVSGSMSRARAAQLAATRASLIASRTARDHARLDLLPSLTLPEGPTSVLADSPHRCYGSPTLVPPTRRLSSPRPFTTAPTSSPRNSACARHSRDCRRSRPSGSPHWVSSPMTA